MERLIVRNFGPIKDVDIEIPRLLVFIGDQASGKSTLAKLIYIFKRISNMMSPTLIPLLPYQPITEKDIHKSVVSNMKVHFDSCFWGDNTYIEYIYTEGFQN